VLVSRSGSRGVGLTYCSQGHTVEGVDEHLPAPCPLPEEEAGWQDKVLLPLFLLAFLTVLVLGCQRRLKAEQLSTAQI
jgi:hypothetical protein